ncbi:MAG: phage portal protein, partial [Bacillaceae bacterium G1]
MAALPLHVYERMEDGGRRRATEHPLYRLLHTRPNPEMTAQTFRDVLTAHLLTWGNGYAEIQYGPDGYPKALWPIPPNRCQPERDEVTKEIRYRIHLPEGGMAILRPEQVFHLVGPGFDGLKGYSIVQLFRESIGMGMSVQEYGARFFGNGAKPGGVLKTTKPIRNLEQIERLRREWAEIHQGLSNAHRVAILEEGMDYVQIGIPPEDAQFLQTRAFQRSEMAAIFQVPPHKIGDLERATFSNIEHQAREFYTDTLLYWLSLWEQTIQWKLIP